MGQSLSNNEIKRIRSLSQKKFRDEYGLFVVEGEKSVAEALDSDYEVQAVYRRDEIGEEAMSRISQLSSPSPALAVVKMPRRSTDAPLESKLYIALDSLRDPGNLGTIIRIADWFGIDEIFAAPDTVDVFNPKVVQATMGAIFRVKVHYCELPAKASAFLAAGGKVYGTFLDGDNMYTKKLETGENCPVMIVIGNESEGISPEMEQKVSDRLFIPPYPADCRTSESLNAAIATAITVAEFRRPR